MTYKITNEETSEFVELDSEIVYEQALNHLGFYLTLADKSPMIGDSDEIKEYALMDSTDNTLVFNFFEGWHENACLKALTELGYSVEEQQIQNVLHVTF